MVKCQKIVENSHVLILLFFCRPVQNPEIFRRFFYITNVNMVTKCTQKNNVCKCKYTNMWLSMFVRVLDVCSIWICCFVGRTLPFLPEAFFLHLFYYTESFLWHGDFCPVCYQEALDSCILCFFYFYCWQSWNLSSLCSLLVALYKSLS